MCTTGTRVEAILLYIKEWEKKVILNNAVFQLVKILKQRLLVFAVEGCWL